MIVANRSENRSDDFCSAAPDENTDRFLTDAQLLSPKAHTSNATRAEVFSSASARTARSRTRSSGHVSSSIVIVSPVADSAPARSDQGDP